MRTVRTRLTLLTMLVVAITLAVSGIAIRSIMRATLYRELDAQLAEQISHISTGTDLKSPGIKIIHEKEQKKPAQSSTRMVQVVGTSTGLAKLDTVATSPRLIPLGRNNDFSEAWPPEDPEGATRAITEKWVVHDFSGNDGPKRSLTKLVASHVAVAQATASLLPLKRQLAVLDASLLASIPLAILLAAVAGTLVVRSVLRPLRMLTSAAQNLDPDLSSSRLPVMGKDEFADMAAVLNQAFDRTATAFTSLRRFTTDAGHELRTPLATIKGSSSYLLHLTELPKTAKASVEGIDRSADRMGKLVDDLLVLARHDAGRNESHADLFAVRVLMDEIIEDLATITDPSLLTESVFRGEDNFSGDPELVRRVVTNLLTNAFRYANSSVSLSCQVHPDLLTVVVQDDGDGIAPDHLARLGERFYRPDADRDRQSGGFGLGLAIAQSLCQEHGGELVLTSERDNGTVATATFHRR